MPTYVLDASAVIRFLDDEPGAERLVEILNACEEWRAKVCISAVQWGEVAGNLRKRYGPVREKAIMSAFLPIRVAQSLRVTQKCKASAIRLPIGFSYYQLDQ